MSPERLIVQPEQTINLVEIIDSLKIYLDDNPDIHYRDEFVDYIERSRLTYLWGEAIRQMGEPVEPVSLDPAIHSQALEDQFVKIRRASTAMHSFEANLTPVSAVGDRLEMPTEEDNLMAPSIISAHAIYKRAPYLRIFCPVTPALALDRTRPIKVEYTTYSNPRNRFTQKAIFNPNEPREEIPNGDVVTGLRVVHKLSELLIESAEKTLAERNGTSTYAAD